MRRRTPTRRDSRVRKRFEVDPIGRPAAASTARWVSCASHAFRERRWRHRAVGVHGPAPLGDTTSVVERTTSVVCVIMAAIPGSLLFAWCALLAVVPLRRRRRLAAVSWISSAVPNELPFLFLYIVVGSNVSTIVDGSLDAPSQWLSLALAVLTSAGLVVIARRSLRTGPVVERALVEGLGPRWRSELDPVLAGGLRRHLPWARILFLPWMFGRRDVERLANVAYGEGGPNNLLDVYRHRSHPSGAPTLIYCTAVGSIGAARTGRPVHSSTTLPAKVGPASAPTTTSLRQPTPSPTTSSTSRRSSPGSAPMVTSTEPIPTRSSLSARRLVPISRRRLHSPSTTRPSNPASKTLTPRSPPASVCTATTARSPTMKTHRPARSPTTATRHRSSSSTATTTPTRLPTAPEPSSSTSMPRRPTRSCTPNFPAPNTPSTSSTRCASRPSSTASRRSWRVRSQHRPGQHTERSGHGRAPPPEPRTRSSTQPGPCPIS